MYDSDDIHHPFVQKLNKNPPKYRKTSSKSILLSGSKSSNSRDTQIDQNYDLNPGTFKELRRPK